MATGGLYGSTSTGTVAPQSGSESVGLYGNNTVFGGTYFEWLIFQESSTQPATPTGGSWNFITNSGTAPAGWSQQPPTNPSNKVWLSLGIVNSKTTAAITWTTPGLFTYNNGTVTNVSALTIGTSGTDVSSTVANSTTTPVITLNLPTASASNRGVLSAADWTAFNAKQPSGTYVGSVAGTTGRITSTGGTNPVIDLASGIATAGTTGSSSLVPVITVDSYGRVTNITTAANPQGSVTSVDATVPSFLSVSGNPITSSGTLAITYSGTALPVANGGTGLTTAPANGALDIGNGTGFTRTTLSAGTGIAISNGPGSISISATSSGGSVTSVAATVPSFLSVTGSPITTSGTLAINYSGLALPVANGGTGATTAGGALTSLGAVGSVASADGSVTISRVGSAVDLSVATAASTTDVLVQVRNTTGATLTKGTVVYMSGATGQIPTVSKALATSDATSAQTLGMMTADLANNTNGYVTVIGLITNIDTSAFTDGAQLYLSGTTAGTYTSTKQYAPIHLVYVGVVEYAHPTQGKIFVKAQNGYELDEIHNVSARTPTTGQTIVWNSATNLWEQNTVSLTAGVNGTLPVANGGTGVTTSTGSGSVVLSTSPTLVTPALGTPTSGVLTNATGLPLTTGVTGTLPVANGGTGTTTPSLVAGTNVTITGTWPNQTINSTGGGGGGSGTVTSVGLSAPSLFTVSGSPVTTSGTLSLTYSGTALPVANGGTGQTTASAAFNALSPVTSTGDLIIGNGVNSATRLPIGTNGQVLTSNGTTAAWAAATGGVSQIVAGSNVTISPTGGTGVVTINATSGSSAYTRTSFTATSGQTAFTVTYAVGYLQVYINGVLLATSDYTATSGTGFTLNVGCSAGDIVEALVITTSVVGVSTGKSIAMALIFGY